MNHKAIVSAALFAASAFSVSAADGGLLLTMKIERNGEVISSPKLLTEYGKDTSVQVGQEFRLEVNAADLGKTADLRMNVSTSQGGALQLAASPRVLATFLSEAAVQVTDQAGVVYRVSVTASRVEKPV